MTERLQKIISARGLASRRKAEEWIAQCGHTKAGTVCMAILFLWSFVSLSQVSVFLYFNF